MTAQLKSAGHVLSDEQQLQAVIRSLPNNCEYLKVKLTHNDNIKAFFDVAGHVELEDERLGAAKAASNAFVAESSGTKSSGFKRKNNWKRYGKTKRLEKDPLRKIRNQIPRKENIFLRRETREKRSARIVKCWVISLVNVLSLKR